MFGGYAQSVQRLIIISVTLSEQVIEYDRQIINDERVHIDVMSSTEPHPISPSHDESFGYQNIKTSILQVWKARDVVVSPGNDKTQ